MSDTVLCPDCSPKRKYPRILDKVKTKVVHSLTGERKIDVYHCEECGRNIEVDKGDAYWVSDERFWS
ncbi:MAG: hypothetical protein LLF82_000329 [Dehalococcoides mccartyi]|nr:hypothetical protein [Dehalococcoides mccartyi]